MKFIIVLDLLKFDVVVKGLVTELAPPHAQSAWGSRGENVRAVRLVASCCNYFSKKKKKKKFDIVVNDLTTLIKFTLTKNMII